MSRVRFSAQASKFLLSLVLSTLSILVGCGGGGSSSGGGGTVPPVSPTLTSISLSPTAPSLTVGGTADLQATGNYSNSTSTTPFDSQVIWTSSSPSVATVDAAGVVSALTVGSTTITAAKSGIQGSAQVTVSTSAAPTLTSISISPAAPSLSVGATTDLQATGNYSNGTSTTPFDSQVTWSSSSPAVATVNAAGLVTAVAVGSTTITAAKGGVQGTATVTITAVATPTLISISLSPSAPSVSVGGTVDLQATGNYSNGTSTTPFDSQVTWSSSNTAIATVNAAGVVTAVASGTSTITAAKGAITGTVNVTVTLAARTLTGISLNPTTLALHVGLQADIAASAIWSDGTGSSGYNSSCTWSTSNAAVATVSTLGMVTPVAAGTATITATSSGKTATCAVTVTAAIPVLTSLTLSPATGSIGLGSTLGLVPIGHYSDGSSNTIAPATAVQWSSSNGAVATVSTSGLVTGVGAGSATITGTLTGKSGSAVITVTAPSFDSRLVGNWKWIGLADLAGSTYGSFYHFYANGTFTYDLIYMAAAGTCITTSQVVAHHEGTFSTQGGLDNLASAGQVIFSCSAHFTDYSNCSGFTTRTSWTGSNPHFHWAAFGSGNLYTNHTDDFQPTGNIQHIRY